MESVGARLLTTGHVYSTRDIVDVIYVIFVHLSLR